jgi:hypothetical protein
MRKCHDRAGKYIAYASSHHKARPFIEPETVSAQIALPADDVPVILPALHNALEPLQE